MVLRHLLPAGVFPCLQTRGPRFGSRSGLKWAVPQRNCLREPFPGRSRSRSHCRAFAPARPHAGILSRSGEPVMPNAKHASTMNCVFQQSGNHSYIFYLCATWHVFQLATVYQSDGNGYVWWSSCSHDTFWIVPSEDNITCIRHKQALLFVRCTWGSVPLMCAWGFV